MKLTNLAFTFTCFSSLVVANPQAAISQTCMSKSYAELLVARYAAVIAHEDSDLGSPTRTAEIIAASNYQEFSDSANIEIGLPLGGPTAPNKATFVSESQSNPAFHTTTLAIHVACNDITWQWVTTTLGSTQYEVKGIHVFCTDGVQLVTTYFEFNSVAGALDTGYTITSPNGTVMT